MRGYCLSTIGRGECAGHRGDGRVRWRFMRLGLALRGGAATLRSSERSLPMVPVTVAVVLLLVIRCW